MIYIVVDYKGYHSSKINAVPYKSGMNLKELKNLLEKKKVINHLKKFSLSENIKNYSKVFQNI